TRFDCDWSSDVCSSDLSKPALRTELLFYLSFLAAAALLVGVATMVVVTVLAPQRTFVLLLLLVGLEVGVFVVFGGSLVQRLVLQIGRASCRERVVSLGV